MLTLKRHLTGYFQNLADSFLCNSVFVGRIRLNMCNLHRDGSEHSLPLALQFYQHIFH